MVVVTDLSFFHYSEVLYEDEDFAYRKLAALVASKVCFSPFSLSLSYCVFLGLLSPWRIYRGHDICIRGRRSI